MRATAESRVVPYISDGYDGTEVPCLVDMLKDRDYVIEANETGTQVEGELMDILDSIEEIHGVLLKEGNSQLISYLKI
ncbi:MAG TPA: thiamine-binding protein [Thiotrichaceae bacterium]|nr:thiamine-binding protein [Thiotrichaceae bacterium]HIM08679.1 thiamine-binding protein [Gammaproteobacteria bacterium]